MATVYQRDGSPYYWMRFNHQGTRYCESTNEKTEGKARKVMKARIAEIKGSGSYHDLFQRFLVQIERLPAKKQLPLRQEYALKLVESFGVTMEVGKAWDAWLKNPKKRNPSEKTVASYKGAWDRFKGWLQKNYPKTLYLHQITEGMAEEYLADLNGNSIKPATYNRHLVFLRSMFHTLKVSAGLMINPWGNFPKMELDQDSKRNLTPKELSTVCTSATGVLRCMFAIGLYTGLRLGDTVMLRWEDIDFKEKTITVIPQKTRRRGKRIQIPLHPALESVLKQINHGTGYLFPAEVEEYRKDPSAITRRIQEFFEACGIRTHKKGTGKTPEYKTALKRWNDEGRKGPKPTYPRAVVEVGFHSMRHSFVSLCAAGGVPQVAIQHLVGHGSPEMTRLYMHSDAQQARRAIQTLPSIEALAD